jgi:hypothetical protein
MLMDMKTRKNNGYFDDMDDNLQTKFDKFLDKMMNSRDTDDSDWKALLTKYTNSDLWRSMDRDEKAQWKKKMAYLKDMSDKKREQDNDWGIKDRMKKNYFT